MSSDARTFEAGDDGFHEIQLNGKQLVFLGMATTLVSVVIFLCGVLVGRGVRAETIVADATGTSLELPVEQPQPLTDPNTIGLFTLHMIQITRCACSLACIALTRR